MGENLVIVESPAKAKTIEKFLGKGYTVKSSFGHIRDIPSKNLGIDITNGFSPNYEISNDKKKVVDELSSLAKAAKTVWLASDEDREGEAIAWHLLETLGLDESKTKRIVFHEITKNAILSAIENPRTIDMNLVMAQQARRVLDRLVGFELSPILWKKVQPKLSAGRVQSVAVKLIVDREREINAFEAQTYYRVEGVFTPEGSKSKVSAAINKRFETKEEAEAFLEKCKNCTFKITSIEKKDVFRTPAAPFTTSALQQEAARKLGFSVNQTMSVAQQLYEAGLITYMRTDSTNLSSLAINTAKDVITNTYGAEYSHPRNYQTKVKGAQEAHEAIRPTYMSNTDIDGSATEKKLYNLIWKRAVASQMADAKLEKTIIEIDGSNFNEKFIAEGEKVIFDGFLKLYIESSDDDENEETAALLPDLNEGLTLSYQTINATEKFTQKPPRYSEASLVKKLEELGIGRPSTYAPTISTITKRGYILKSNRPAVERQYCELQLKNEAISSTVKIEKVGAEKNRLSPENIGIVVTDFLAKSFPDILNYGFTAKVEEDFDKVAEGELIWNDMIGEFYKPFHNKVENTLQDKVHTNAERLIGTDPATGKPVIARIGKFGPLVQKGDSNDPDRQFVALAKGQLIETITLEEALTLFNLPRKVGKYNDQDIIAAIGKFGPYVKYGSSYVSIPKQLSPYTITEEEAVTVITDHLQAEAQKTIKDFVEDDIHVLNGRFGPYIKQGKNNYKIPKGVEAKSLTLEQCKDIIAKDSSPKKNK